MARVKSLAGIGALLMDGIGDTVRVSLTEHSANEIIFGEQLLGALESHRVMPLKQSKEVWSRPLNHQRVVNKQAETGTIKIGQAAHIQVGVVGGTVLPAIEIPFIPEFFLEETTAGYRFSKQSLPLKQISLQQLINDDFEKANCSALLINDQAPLRTIRRYYASQTEESSLPIGMLLPILSEDLAFEVELSCLLSEGLLDFLIIPDGISGEQLRRLLLLLQATRSKTFVTDFIACPSCGRTLFDLESTTAAIKEKTHHLKGLKIGIMGCIVNGPGEMADADFGYVGSGKGKIDLYYGQSKVQRNIDEKDAVAALIQLIKDKEMWVEQ